MKLMNKRGEGSGPSWHVNVHNSSGTAANRELSLFRTSGVLHPTSCLLSHQSTCFSNRIFQRLKALVELSHSWASEDVLPSVAEHCRCPSVLRIASATKVDHVRPRRKQPSSKSIATASPRSQKDKHTAAYMARILLSEQVRTATRGRPGRWRRYGHTCPCFDPISGDSHVSRQHGSNHGKFLHVKSGLGTLLRASRRSSYIRRYVPRYVYVHSL